MSKPEFVRARLNTTSYDKYMHEACYFALLRKDRGKGIFKQLMMNNFFKGKKCSACKQLLQCKCNQFKVTEPKTGKCKHDD